MENIENKESRVTGVTVSGKGKGFNETIFRGVIYFLKDISFDPKDSVENNALYSDLLGDLFSLVNDTRNSLIESQKSYIESLSVSSDD